MTLEKKIQYGFVAALLILGFIAVFRFSAPVERVIGSTIQGNDYFEVSFGATNALGASTTPGKVKTGAGSLGSVVITGANTGTMAFYDATTTNASLRAASQSTSTIYLGSIPASAAAGTYVFDVAFSRGLMVDIYGSAPTSTVTWR